MKPASLTVEVIYAVPDAAWIRTVRLPAGATLADAIQDAWKYIRELPDFKTLAKGVTERMVKEELGKQIGGQTYDKYGNMGDNGANSKSIALTKPKVVATGANPVKFSGQAESVPTSPKAPSNYGAKGETTVKGAGSFKNAPAQKGQDLEKAPAPVKSQASGVNTKSPVSESRKTAKKRI